MVYANYAATTATLSKAVADGVKAYLDDVHLNAGRNFEGIKEATVALRARSAVASLLCVENPLDVVFSSGATASLNMAISGLARAGDHVLATSIEHNAVARPLESLAKRGMIDVEWIPCERDGSLSPEKVSKAIRNNTRMLVMSHASNVLGTILPVEECFRIAHEHGVFTVLDMAQTAGVLPFSVGEHCDIAVFAGHKGLGALAGTGGCVIGKRAVDQMQTWISGGTGSLSHSLDMPDKLPDRFEPGTQNTVGILSLALSVEEIMGIGVGHIREKEQACLARFIEGIGGMEKIVPYGTLDPIRSVAVISLSVKGYDAADASLKLFEKGGIVTRSGLHCSPLAHKTAGTYPGGTVRFSFGRETTEDEIDAMLEALSAL